MNYQCQAFELCQYKLVTPHAGVIRESGS